MVRDSTKTSSGIYHITFEKCPVGLAHVSPDGQLIETNQKLCDFLGYTKEELKQLTFQQITPWHHLEPDLRQVKRLLDGEVAVYSIEKQYVHKAGHLVWARLTVSLVRNDDGSPAFFISMVEDIDENKRMASRLYESEEAFRQIVGSLSDRMVVWVAAPALTQMFYVNNGYLNIWGESSSELFADPKAFLKSVHKEDRARVHELYNDPHLSRWEIDYRIKRADGDIRYIRDRGIPIADEQGRMIYLVGTADDVTSDRCLNNALSYANQKLERLSRIDSLTGVYNRREIISALDAEANRLKRSGTVSSVLFLDLDNFKVINDNFGHYMGDKALVLFAEYVQQHLRTSDKLGRYGGDEFVVLLTDTDHAQAASFLTRLNESPVQVSLSGEVQFTVEFSAGIAAWTADVDGAQAWLDEADSDMYEIKKARRGH